MRFFKFKNKIKKSSFLENYFLEIFYFGFSSMIIKAFLTPHDSRNLTTVKFLESAPPQGGSYSPLMLQVFLKFVGV
jgi:hypothetical protein